ncbi:MAG: DUF1569 domain-containing protein [Cyanobacteriota bacterium]|nr:DUF1569 domain-containing protein [Cyanobacteriota bacterium]
MWINFMEQHDQLTIASSLEQIEQLENKSLRSIGTWTPYQIFIHCAQSVEYSMLGYPEQKPEIFQTTIGKLAFSIFSFAGRMIHPLDDPIPGAPNLDDSNNIQLALNRLKSAYINFERYSGPLAPHFIYGDLTKEEYTLAHVMHLNNHLDEIRER